MLAMTEEVVPLHLGLTVSLAFTAIPQMLVAILPMQPRYLYMGLASLGNNVLFIKEECLTFDSKEKTKALIVLCTYWDGQ